MGRTKGYGLLSDCYLTVANLPNCSSYSVLFIIRFDTMEDTGKGHMAHIGKLNMESSSMSKRTS